jgi:hypothetical protein
MDTERKVARTANSTFAIGGVSSSADILVVAESFVHRINICGKSPAIRVSAKRYVQKQKNKETANHQILKNFYIDFRFVN